MKSAAMLLLLASPCIAAPATAQTSPPASPTVAANGLAEDILTLRARVEALHPNPYRRISRDDFGRRLDDLQHRLSTLSRDQALVGMMQLVAALGDGHTTVLPWQSDAGWHILPLRFHAAGGRLFVDGADRRYAAVLGKSVETIGGMAVAAVIDKVRTVTPGDNTATVDGRVGSYISIPEVLAGLGIIAQPGDPVPMTFADGERPMRLDVVPTVPPHGMSNPMRAAYSSDWLDLPSALPSLSFDNLRRSYWYRWDDASRSLFVQYNAAASDAADPMPAFAKRLREEIAARQPARVILDLRFNPGGEAFWNRSLLLALIRSPAIEPAGKLFVLIGPQTFSAATLLAIDLEKYTNAVFIGEPTGGSLQNFGNHVPVTLPNSKLRLMVATRYYQNNGPNDDRPWIAPQVLIESSRYLDLKSDPALDAAITYRTPIDVLSIAMANAQTGEETERAYRSFAANPVNHYLDTNAVLIAYGYRMLHVPNAARAVTIMELATRDRPNSDNAFDSLGDAYRAAGRRDDAITAYRRAPAINPDWQSARQSLIGLGVTPPPGGHF